MAKNKYHIDNISTARERFLKLIEEKEGYKVIQVYDKNNAHYSLIKGDLRGESHNIYLLFKRDFFNSFGAIFKDKGEYGLGDTINTEQLRECMAYEVKKIFFIYEDFKIYFITPQLILDKGYKRINDFESKETYSFNIKHLTRWDIVG